MNSIKLNFKDHGSGFELDNPNFKGDIFGLHNYELGDYAFAPPGSGIVHMFETFMDTGLSPLKYFVDEARRLNIPGLYTVPELGVKDAPFWKVLEAVKAYYEKKAGLKEAA